MAVLLALLAVLCVSAPLVAQDGREYRAPRSSAAQGRAYDSGYRRGENRGQDDARHNRAFDYARDRDYRNADNGYDRRYGDRDGYRDEFRRGFLAGYTRGYQAYAPRGFGDRDYGYRNPGYDGRAVPRQYSPYGARINAGYNKGYNDGVEKGRNDVRRNRSYDPNRHDWYRDADRGWSRLFGLRIDYAAAYRQGFLEGYRAAYGQGRYLDRRW